MPWKDQKENKKATCGKFVSPQQLLWASCCWDAEGISCSFCAIAIHQHTEKCAWFTCSYRELHEVWDFTWNTFLATFYTISYTNTTWNLSMEQRSIRMLLITCVWEPHINLDSLTFHPVSQRKWSKFHLKIPAHESQHILQSNLSQTHSYHGLKRPKRK